MNQLNNDFKFSKKIKQFKLGGIPIIGNTDNMTIIGLDNDGTRLISDIKNGNLNINNLNEKQQQLFSALKENDFFKKYDDSPNYLNHVYIHVTDNCNLHCVGCYSYVDCRNEKKDLSLEQIKIILKKLKDNGTSSITISGGEPFLRLDLPDILKYIKESLLIEDIKIISNGTMPKERYEACIPYLKHISISIDGYNENTSFIRDPGIMPKIFETVNYLKDKIPLSLIATLSKKNSSLIKEYQKLSIDIGVPLSFSILTLDYSNPIFKDYVLDKEDYDKINKFIFENNDINLNDSPIYEGELTCKTCCGAGNSFVSIGADGSLYPCPMMHHEKTKLGNVLTDDPLEIVKSDKNLCNGLSVDKLEECKDCEYKYVCGGGCRASSFHKYGDVLHPDISCKQFKEYFKFKVDNIKKIYNIQ